MTSLIRIEQFKHDEPSAPVIISVDRIVRVEVNSHGHAVFHMTDGHVVVSMLTLEMVEDELRGANISVLRLPSGPASSGPASSGPASSGPTSSGA